MATIRVDYDRALRQAQRLSQAAQKCTAQASNARKIAARLESAWIGDSGSAMRQKYLDWAAEETSIASGLNETASRIRNVVRQLQEAEREAILRAKALEQQAAAQDSNPSGR